MTAPHGWEAVIGLEVHAQIKTRSKFLTACPVAGGSTADLAPNTFIDPVVLALPGTLPVPNEEAIALAVRLGLALGCVIDRASRLSRKHYFYPDLPKGYQVSQYDDPICQGGAVQVATTSVPLTRIHLEEDAGKTIHDARRNASNVDLNRSGVALVEIVSEPAMHSADHAVAYLKALHRIVTWYDVCDGDMEAGNFRCDANVSVRRIGDPKLGTRTEIKNVNSFKFVGLAINSEIRRQVELLERGETIIQETRGWDEARGQTRMLRSKEDAHDYRYFPDPDLCPLEVSDALIAAQRDYLAAHDLERAESELAALCRNDATTAYFTASRDHLAFARDLAARLPDPAPAFALAMEVIPRYLNDTNTPISALAPKLDALVQLSRALATAQISRNNARQALAAALSTDRPVTELLKELGGQVSDATALAALIDPILDAHPTQVADYLGGKDKLFGFFTGQIMKTAKGKADPAELGRVLRERLESRR